MKMGHYLIDVFRKTKIVENYHLLKEIESEGLSFFKSEQKKRLTSLLLVQKNNNKEYGNIMSNISIEQIRLDPYGVLSELPIVDKNIISVNRDKYLNSNINRKYQFKHTGGSTGTPFFYCYDKESISLEWAFIYYSWNKYANYKLGDQFMTIGGSSLNAGRNSFSKKAYHYLQNNYFINNNFLNENFELNFKKTSAARLIYGYPSSIHHLSQADPDFSANFSNLKAIFTTSEQLLPQVRRDIENSFNVKVFDMYGAGDGGVISCECEEKDGFHYYMLNCFVEKFINEYGHDELLLTSLNSYKFPLIRYRVEDLGEVCTDECKCGLSLYRIKNLKGRSRDLVFVPSYGWIHGSSFNSIFFKISSVRKYKIIQHENYNITICLELYSDSKFEKVRNIVLEEMTNKFRGIKVDVETMPPECSSNKKYKIIENHVC